uniref:saccharopine dehydrogenase family protein n=1 Tax=Faecalicatena contorta TaxID=39482 RepID=UPI00359C456D
MSRILVIGCGGVASVAIRKCCQNEKVFTELCIASRTKAKCDALREKLEGKTSVKITTAQVDADHVSEAAALIRSYQPDVVLNLALPYQDLSIMEACLECGVHYIDSANYEPEDTDDPAWRAVYEKRCREKGFTAYFDYSWQWEYNEKFREKNLTALLGSGFDPGVTSVFTAYAMKHYFDEIHTIDILDCNGGDHGYPFATNFNPEINLREVSANGSYWEDGHWVETEPMEIKRTYDFPQVGPKEMYLLHHEEIESLAVHVPGVKRIRFFMTFGESYLTHMKCLENVGMLSTSPIAFEGKEIVPIQFLKALLPDPATLGPRTKGKTNIGCIYTGVKDGQEKTIYIYNVCDHEECYREVESQAISYTTGVPAMIGTALVASGIWNKRGAVNLEELDPDPFMDMLNQYGLPWMVDENPETVE